MVIDSHVLVWWLEAPERLSPQAAEFIARASDGDQEALIAPVTFWELHNKERRGIFEPKTPVSQWPALLGNAPWIRILPCDSDVWILAAGLEWNHRDPADRIIAASAMVRGVGVLTRDSEFHKPSSPVKAVW